MIEQIKSKIKESRIPKKSNYTSLFEYVKDQFLTSLPHVLLMTLIMVVFGILVVLFFSDFHMLICLYLVILLVSFIISAFMENILVSIFSGLIFGIISGILCYFVDYSYVNLHFVQVIEICIIMSILICALGFLMWPILIESIE